jgi:hypothetical protein
VRGTHAFGLALAGLGVVLASGSVRGAPLADGAPLVEPSRRADVAVVTYRELLGEIGAADKGPTLRIYGDGRMVAHYPRYMHRAGDYEQRLRSGELDRLLRSLADRGVLDFDAAEARASIRSGHERARATGAPADLFVAADGATTVIEVNLERYRGTAPGAREVRGLAKRVVWTAVQADAQHHPDVASLRALAAADADLRALRERPGYARLR